MAGTSGAFLGAIIGVCVGLGVCVAALIIFVIVFCRVKIKDDFNTRRRLITNNVFDAEKTVTETRPQPIMEEPEPIPVPMPQPRFLPIMRRPLPPPEPMMVQMPRRAVPIVRTPQPAEPRVIIREIIRDAQPAPAPPPQPVVTQTVVKERAGWNGVNDDDWVLVKRIKKLRKNERKAVSDDEEDDDDDDDDNDDSGTGCRHSRGGYRTRRHRSRMQTRIPRLEPYDLATPAGMYAPRPAMMGLMPQMLGGQQIVMAPMAAAAGGPAVAQNYIPIVMQPSM